jgi:hypothetical protein
MTKTATYDETVYRFRILAHDDLPEGHKAEYRAAGIDPDTIWRLVYSFMTQGGAEACLADVRAAAPAWRTYKLVDAGEATVVTRQAW